MSAPSDPQIPMVDPADPAESASPAHYASVPPRMKRGQLVWLGVALIVLLVVVSRVATQAPSSGAALDNTGASRGQSDVKKAKATPSSTKKPTRTPAATTGAITSLTPGPLILLNPGIVRQGSSITVTGSGFDARAIVDLAIKQPGSTSSLASTFIQADKNGTFSGIALTAPASLPAGGFLVNAHQRNSDKSAQATGTVAGGAPQVKLGTQVGKPGDTIALALQGFSPGEPIKVNWNNLSDQPVATFQADGGGSVGQAALQVPFGAVGANTFLFVGSKSQSLVAVSFQVLSLYPTVTLSSYALNADTPLSFTGSGFGPSERVLVYVNNPNGQPVTVIPADKSGSFKNAGSFLVPFALKGQQTLIFMGEQSHSPNAVSFTVLPYTPVVQPSTYGGFPGTTISFFVSGFAHNEVVHVYARHTQQNMGTLVGCFATDDHGSASAAGSYAIPGDAPAGGFGFALQGMKSGGIGLASVNVTTPPMPVQTPPQPPFTCSLDQQQNQTPATSAPQTSSPSAAQSLAVRTASDMQMTSTATTANVVGIVITAPLVGATRSSSPTPVLPDSTRTHGADTHFARLLSEGLPPSASLHVASMSFSGLFVVLALALIWRVWRFTHGQGSAERKRHTEHNLDADSPTRTPPMPRTSTAISREATFPVGAGLTLPGRRRSDPNMPKHDSILVMTGTYCDQMRVKPYGLYVVANGTSDSADGSDVSQRVVKLIADHVAALLESCSELRGSPPFAQLLPTAITRADDDLRAWSANRDVNVRATVTTALVAEEVAYVANVGDCRAYLFDSNTGLRQMTVDHSLVSTLIASGLLPPDAISTHPRRYQVYRWMGGMRHGLQVDSSAGILHPTDQLVLCSNGLWRAMCAVDIESILRTAADPQSAADQLAHFASEQDDGRDISAIVVRRALQRHAGTAFPNDSQYVGKRHRAAPEQE